MAVAAAAVGLGPLLSAKGAPTHRCFGEEATIVGTDGADRIKGTAGRDVIVGLGGNDRISGLGAPFEGYQRDWLCGNEGSDTIYVSSMAGFDTCAGGAAGVSGGKGDDRLFGGGESFSAQGDKGDDLIDGCSLEGDFSGVSFYSSASPVTVKLWNNSARGLGRDTLKHLNSVFGSRFADVIVGSNSSKPESLSGPGSGDTIKGLGGPDSLFGGNGDGTLDSRDGVVGNDVLDGEDGFNTCLFDSSTEGSDHAVECDS